MPGDSSSSLSEQAVSALDTGQPRQAIALLQPACEGGSTDPRHWFLLGTALGMTGDGAGAEQAFRKVLAWKPGQLQAMTNLSKALAIQGRLAEAVTVLERVQAISPGHRPACIYLIKALIQSQRLAEAEQQCEQLLAINENDAEVLILLGNVHRQQGAPDRALARFDQALAAEPGHVAAHLGKGLTLKSTGDNRTAIECLTRAIRLEPGNPAIWFNRGITHVALNELEQAAQDLEEAFRLNPGDVTAGGQLANVYRHLRRLPESVEISRRILAVDPGNVRARFFVEAFENQASDRAVQRIPREMVETTYGHADVGRHFEASLKGGLEYKAPDVLDEAVREVCGRQASSLDILELGCGTGLCGSRFADIARTLVGTDVSTSMLDAAREKNAYTDLYVADLVDVLSENPACFDLVIAMDVLCYFGDLTEIFRMCHDTLRPGGVFALSVEKPDGDEPWLLHPYGHFVHSLRHLRQAAARSGFEEAFVREMVLRREIREHRVGHVCLFRRT